MPTGRHPRVDLNDTQDDERPRAADTIDSAPIRARGSHDHDPVAQDVDFFDRGKDDPSAPRNVDLGDRLSAVEVTAKKMSRRWGWVVALLSALTAAVAPVSVYAVKALLAHERAAGAEVERLQTLRDDHLQIQANSRAIAEIRGALWTLNPAGAVRLQGAARGPAPDPVTP